MEGSHPDNFFQDYFSRKNTTMHDYMALLVPHQSIWAHNRTKAAKNEMLSRWAAYVD